MRKQTMRKVQGACLGGAAALLFSVAGIQAYQEVSATYRLSTGKVDIELEEWTKTQDGMVPWEFQEQVLPGQQLSRIARIRNDAAECYVRARVLFHSEQDVEEPLSEDHLLGVSEDWVKRGDYYYYRNRLEPEETVDLFTGIQVPTGWDTRYDEQGEIQSYYTDQEWELEVFVDAIQTKNFIPDFSSDIPWGIEGEDYVIEKAKEGEPTVYTAAEKNFVVDFAGDTADLIAQPQNFTDGLEMFLPGDSQTRNLELKNTSDKTKTLYLQAECLSEDSLMEQMEVSVTLEKNGKETSIYKGNMKVEALAGMRTLCVMEPGDTGTLQVSFSMPENLTNAYSLKEGAIRFLFTTNEETAEAQHPKTGDPVSLGIPLICLLSGMGTAVCGWKVWKRGRTYE